VPRAFLTKTASSYAYIAKCAIMDERTGELYVDPKTLFSEVANVPQQKEGESTQQYRRRVPIQLPRIFRNSHFHYFHPSFFPNYEPPRDGTPEVAFLGRSNTGKSSLINALSSLIQRAGGGTSPTIASGGGELARTSKRPGRTQTINYFGLISNDNPSSVTPTHAASGNKQQPTNVNQSKLYLVDLPGFGYAAAPGESVDEWQKKTQEFLIARASVPEEGVDGMQPWPELKNPNPTTQISHFGQQRTSPPLKRLYLLLDSRLPDPTMIDLTVMGWCDEYSIPYTIVLTKVDGSSQANCVKLTNQLCMRYHSLYMDTSQNENEEDEDTEGEVHMDPVIYHTSSKDGLGMEELLLSVENNMFAAEDEYDVENSLDDDDDGDDDDDDLEEDGTSRL